MSHTRCVHDLFRHIHSEYVTYLIRTEIGHIHSLSIVEYFLAKDLFLRASTNGDINYELLSLIYYNYINMWLCRFQTWN